MEKSPVAIYDEGLALLDSGKFCDALRKFKTALTAQQKVAKDEKNIVVIRQCIIRCHGRLEEVSGPGVEDG